MPVHGYPDVRRRGGLISFGKYYFVQFDWEECAIAIFKLMQPMCLSQSAFAADLGYEMSRAGSYIFL